MANLLNIVLLLPLFSFVSICLAGTSIGIYGSIWISLIGIVAALLASLSLLLCYSFDHSMYIDI